MSAIQELLEREVGHLVLELLGEQGAGVGSMAVRAAERRALDILGSIQAVLDGPERSDFDCVEDIVCILEQADIGTSRHDFG